MFKNMQMLKYLKTRRSMKMSNINLKDSVTLEGLFNEVDSWGNMPVSSLNEQQLALINLKKAVTNQAVADKNGGASAAQCFICFTGA